MTDRQYIEQRAADWLALRDGTDWSPREAQELEAWLVESTANRVAFLRLESAWRSLDEAEVTPAWRRILPSMRPIPARAVYWAAAATICLCLLATFLMLRPSVSTPQIAYSTAVGEVRSHALADGSEIDLNTDSRLRAAIGRDSRMAWLDQGEAYFSIKRDPARPFTIFSEGQEIRVVGTQFTVRREPGEVRVMVVEGRVELRASGGHGGSINLGAGDAAIVTRKSKLIVHRDNESLRYAMGWRRSMLTFRSARLSDVAAEFNRYNDRKLVIADPDLNDMQIGGQFQTTRVEEFARLLEAGYSLKATYADREIRVSK